MEISSRLSPVQRYLYHAVAQRSSDWGKGIAFENLLPSQEAISLRIAIEKLETARIVINVNLREVIHGKLILDWLLETKRLLNLFELLHTNQHSRMVDIRRRLIAEYRLYGGELKVQSIIASMSNTEHPNYGQLDYIGDPIELPSLGYFGFYRFVLRDEAKFRSTFTPDDSNNIKSEDVFVWDSIAGVLATEFKLGTEENSPKHFWFDFVNSEEAPVNEFGFIRYIESQTLGGVIFRDTGNKQSDAERLYYPQTDMFDGSFFEKLRQLHDRFGIDLIPY